MVEEHLQTFIRNAGETTGVGILGLAVTALLLINTIQTAFDRIWGGGRGFKIQRFPVYWALLTLGPILFGIAFSISSYAFALAQSSSYMSGALRLYSWIAPFLLEAVGFLLFYRLMPTRPVRWMDAACGAIIAAVLFEVLKRAFGYLSRLPRHLSDALWRAGDAADLPDLDVSRLAGGADRRGDHRVAAGVALGPARSRRASARAATCWGWRSERWRACARSRARRAAGRSWTISAASWAPRSASSPTSWTCCAARASWSGATIDRWVLARDLNAVTLNDLVSALNLSLADIQDVPRQTEEVMTDLAAAERGLLDRSIEDTLKSHGLTLISLLSPDFPWTPGVPAI